MKQLSFLEDASALLPECNTPAGAHWKVYVDGASRNNPGPAGAGVFITKELAPVEKKGFYLGLKTNNQAEYYALLLGLFLLQPKLCPQDTVLIISDSQLLIRQLQGRYRVKNADLVPLCRAAKNIMQTMNVQVAHVLREENSIADKLANQGIDQKNNVSQAFFVWLKNYAA